MSTHTWPSPSSPLVMLRRAASGRLNAASGGVGTSVLYGSMPWRSRWCHMAHAAPFEHSRPPPSQPQRQKTHIAPSHVSTSQRIAASDHQGPLEGCFAAAAEGRSAHPASGVAQAPPSGAPNAIASLRAAAAVASAAAAGLRRCPPSPPPSTPATAATAAKPSPAAASTSIPTSPSPSPSSPPSHATSSSPSPSISPAPAPAAAAAAAAAATSSAPLEGSPVPWATLGPSLDLIQQILRVGTTSFRLVAPRDVDAVMDMYLEKGLLDADPYWTRPWPSAIALAAEVLARPELVRGKVVADLGAGLGLAGMAAAMAGAKEVVLLDREPLALQCALLSAAASGLDSVPDLNPNPEPVPESAAGPPTGPSSAYPSSASTPSPRRGRVLVEPLPADQLPSHSSLQLSPHSSFVRDHPDGGSGDAATDSAAEWGALVNLARGLNRGSAAAAVAADGGGRSTVYDSLLRAHVFDWTAPPEMDRLLPAAAVASRPPQPSGASSGGSLGRAGSRRRQRRFDVVLACDVLYEDAAVGPIAGLMPLLLEPEGGRLLLADPPNRTVRNRERFLQELRSGPLRLAVEECSLQQCEVSKLDNEMAGGLAPTAETVPVQFLVFRSCVGNNTVGLKL